MLDIKKIEQIISKIKNTVPKGIRELGEDLDKKLRTTVQSHLGFKKLNFISREEFDVQIQVLLEIREKMIEIENRIKQLEQKQLTNKNEQ